MASGVYAQRDERRIVTRAHLQFEAWDEALRQVGIVQRSPVTVVALAS